MYPTTPPTACSPPETLPMKLQFRMIPFFPQISPQIPPTEISVEFTVPSTAKFSIIAGFIPIEPNKPAYFVVSFMDSPKIV